MLTKIKKQLVISRPDIIKNEYNLYFTGGFIYKQNEYSVVKSFISSGEKFDVATKLLKKGIEEDNVEFYLLVSQGVNYLISLFDPFEYLEKDKILDIWEVPCDYLDLDLMRQLK